MVASSAGVEVACEGYLSYGLRLEAGRRCDGALKPFRVQ